MDLNESVKTNPYIDKGLNFISKFAELIKNQVESLGLKYTGFFSTIFTLFLGTLMIFIGLKIANKMLKVIIFILGAILILGTIAIFFKK